MEKHESIHGIRGFGNRAVNAYTGGMTNRTRIKGTRATLLLGIAALASLPLMSGSSGWSATATASATIVRYSTVKKRSEELNGGNLYFGVINLANEDGSVTILPETKSRKRSRSAKKALTLDSRWSDAAFDVEGDPDASYQISVDAEQCILYDGNGHSLTVTDWSFDSDDNSRGRSLDRNGKGGFRMGGTLHFSGDQVPGEYTGTFAVTVGNQ